MGRLLIANLDCETELARVARVGDAHGPLPRRVLARIAGAATLMRVFAGSEDRLWLPSDLAAASLCDVAGLARPSLEHGSLAETPPGEAILAWGETRRVEALRRRAPAGRLAGDGGWVARLWNVAPPKPEIVAAVHDRRFCTELAGQLECALPGACLIRSAGELARHLAAGGADAAAGRWVLKARFAAAGRHRLIRDRPTMPEGPAIERLLQRHGPLLFEPWMDRVRDVGCCALVDEVGLQRIGSHRLRVDAAGRFRGLELRVEVDGNRASGLEPGEAWALEDTLRRVADALGQRGYRGPFGLDAWRYRKQGGETAFHPLGEINARMTFGLVAHALVDRLRATRGIRPGSRVRLLFGRQLPEHGDATATIPLLLASHPVRQAIWLEIEP